MATPTPTLPAGFLPSPSPGTRGRADAETGGVDVGDNSSPHRRLDRLALPPHPQLADRAGI